MINTHVFNHVLNKLKANQRVLCVTCGNCQSNLFNEIQNDNLLVHQTKSLSTVARELGKLTRDCKASQRSELLESIDIVIVGDCMLFADPKIEKAFQKRFPSAKIFCYSKEEYLEQEPVHCC